MNAKYWKTIDLFILFFPITIEELSNRAFKNRKFIIKKAMISFKGSEGGMETRRSW